VFTTLCTGKRESVNDEQVRRRARNESLFRSLNEQINRFETDDGADVGESVDFVCECSSANCMKVVSVSGAEYEAVREGASTFIVAPGHEDPSIEHVLVSHNGFSVVEKRGEAAAVAADTNPRD
jgi:hypothetical protein